MGRSGGLVRADLIGDRYRLKGVLKRGGGVETLLATSLADGSPIVLKRAPSAAMSAALGMRLAHEASVLAGLTDSEGRPFLLDHGADDGWLWLAQRFHDGSTLARRLMDEGSISIDETMRIASSVLRTLVAAHDSGVVHRDVKPANILVTGAERIGSATLIDFGLSRSIGLDQSLRDAPVGTARYCSPEQAGLIEVPVDGRSDIYSLGTTLFECVTGAPLFGAKDIRTVLRQKTDPTVADTVRTSPALPRAVADFLYRMVRAHPDDRYQSAAAVLLDVEQIQDALRSGSRERTVVIGRYDRRASLAEPSFIGRAAELGVLVAHLEQTCAGNGQLITVEGESGCGKSRLLDELAARSTEQGFVVLRGQAEDRTAQRPLRIFDGVAQGIIAAASRDERYADRFASAVGDASNTLLAALPRLGEVLPVSAGSALPEEYAQARSISALATMIDAAGDPERPALVLLDDCQWAETLTIEVLSAWASRHVPRWVMVVAAYRSDGLGDDGPSLASDAGARLKLDPLNERDIRAVVSSMAGPVPERVAAAVLRLGSGNAFMAQAVLRGMVESSAMVHSDGGWVVDPEKIDRAVTSREAALVLAGRLALLSSGARTLLEAGAVLGKTFDLDVAVDISELDNVHFVEALDEVRARRILWVDRGGRRARFSHDKLRDAVLDELHDDSRAALHGRAAVRISSTEDAAPFELAYHYDAAGRTDKALPHAVVAAERSRNQHALEDAEFYYRIALNSTADEEMVAQLADGLGEVLALAGRYDEAEAQFARAAANSENPRFRAVITGKVGEVEFRKGDQVNACAHLESALRGLGRWVPKRRLSLLIGTVWEIVVQVLHSILPTYPRRGGARPSGDEKLAMRFYSRLAYAYWFRKGRIPCLWAHLREMNMAERYGPSPELAQAYSEHAPVMTMLPWYSRGVEYAERSLHIRQLLEDVWGQGQSLSFQGVVLYSASRYEEAIECCREAVQLLEPTGDQWEINTATWHIALSQYRLGRLAAAARMATDLYARADRIGDMSSAGIALSAWSRATGGQVPRDAIAEAMRRENEDVHTWAEINLAEAVRLISSNRPAQADEILKRAWADVRAAGLRQEYVAPLPAWWATAIRLRLESLDRSDPAATELRKKHRKVARTAVRLSRSYRNNLPHALRELALAEAASGRVRKARRLLEESVAVAESQQARWEAAKGLEHLASLGGALGWPGAGEDLARAKDLLWELEGAAQADHPGLTEHPSASLSVAARFSSLLETGRALAAASSASSVYETVTAAGAELLGAERCHVLEIRDDYASRLDTESAAEIEGLSVSAVREAVETGEVVFRAPNTGAGVTDSMVLSGVKSLLCAPIFCNGRVVACLYAVHKEIGGLFGDVECQLARFVATLAGATLEHVSGDADRFRALVEHSSDVTFLTGTDGITRYASPAVSNVLGWAPEDILGHSNKSRVHPDDYPGATRAFLDALAIPGSSSRTQFRVVHKDGSWRTVEVSYTNRLHDPLVNAVVVNLHDITERRQVEQRLERVAEQFRLAFENAPIGMALVSHRPEIEGQLVMANDALATMLGYERPSLERMTARELTHPDDRASEQIARRRIDLGQIDRYHGERRFMSSSGNWVWVSIHSNLVRNESGDPDYSVLQVVDITEKKMADATLKHHAYTDPLTRLDNRWLFLSRLPQSLARARRRGTYLAVFFMDVDNFKVINDSHGHSAGDRVLEEIAARLRSVTRSEDILARLGGDEFVLVVDDIQERDEVKGIAARIEEVLRQSIEVGPGIHVKVTASLGITVADLDDDAQSLLRDADTALYRAKDRGRARYEIFGEHLRVRALARERAERELRGAIDDERLLLHYQPIVDLKTERTIGLEALVRYEGPTGLVFPADFINVAEETGLIVPIGAWVLKQACNDLTKLRELSGNPELHVGVNVSPRQLADPQFADAVADVIDFAGIDPGAVAIEITEHALMNMIEPARRSLERLRQVGCTTGIDDFGTGYSSLVLLTRLPLDFLKIDQTFVRGLGVNRDSEAIVKALVGLSGSLGMVIKAEGVETREQADFLRQFGCDRVQGYLYSRPLPLEDLFH